MPRYNNIIITIIAVIIIIIIIVIIITVVMLVMLEFLSARFVHPGPLLPFYLFVTSKNMNNKS